MDENLEITTGWSLVAEYLGHAPDTARDRNLVRRINQQIFHTHRAGMYYAAYQVDGEAQEAIIREYHRLKESDAAQKIPYEPVSGSDDDIIVRID